MVGERGFRAQEWEGGCNFKQEFRAGLTKKGIYEQRLKQGEGTVWLFEGRAF